MHNHASYQVSTKALIFKNDRILVLISPDNYLDFPGGRVEESERDIPWTEVLKREVAEELGESVEIEIGKTLFVSKRQYRKGDAILSVAAIFFKCHFIGGELKLSEEHRNHAWLTPDELLSGDLKFVSEDERNQILMLIG